MNAYQIITNQIVELLEQGTCPWRRPWVDGPATRSYHGRAYRGINAMLLSAVASARGLRGCWLTFNQVKKLGGYVKKGSKGVPVSFWKWIDEVDDGGDKTGRTFPICRYYTVFSICQTEGIEEPAWVAKGAAASEDVDPIDTAEAIWEGYQGRPELAHGGDRACYRPLADTISMPHRGQFETAAAYYSTLFHEATHSTGHKRRLDRPGVSHGAAAFGSETYSREELVAEMGAAFLDGAAGIDTEGLTENSAAYLQSWIRVLKGDPKLAVVAGAQAQKAADHILGHKFED